MPAPPAGPQQDDIATEALDTSTVSDQFREAVQKYNSVQRSESKPMFESIVTGLEDKEALTEEEHLVLTESLKFLGIITFPDDTWFEKLIRFDPSYDLDAKNLSPKIVQVFTKLRTQLVGSLRVSALDASSASVLDRASLVIDGKLVGSLGVDSVFPVFTGARTVEIRRPNYDAYIQEVEVPVGEEVYVQALMTRITAELHILTTPAQTQVFLDDRDLGLTTATPSDAYTQQLNELGIPADDAATIIIDDILPGSYNLRFEKQCFQTKNASVQVEEPRQIYLKPVQLTPSGAFLSVTTAGDASAIVFLDSERVGILPVENHRVCPGEYQLRVKFSDGEYMRKIRFEEGTHEQVIAKPLPSIAWFGLQDESEGKPPADINSWLNAMTSWNIQEVDPDNTALMEVNPFPLLFDQPKIAGDGRDALTRKLNTDLYMAARVVRKKVVIRHLEIAFWTPLSQTIHSMSFDFREIDRFKEVLANIDGFPVLTKPWLGIHTARLRGLSGCKVIEVHPNGPLAGKLQPGTFIQSVNGALLRDPSELIAVNGGAEVKLVVDGAEVTATPINTLAEVPFDTKQAAPQALLARFEKLAKYHPDALVRQSAVFNQARFQFFLGDFTDAFDTFSTMNLNTPYGINQGTLFFYQGLCFRRLKQASEATASFTQVLNYPHATLFDAYGPKAAFWAEAEMKNTNL